MRLTSEKEEQQWQEFKKHLDWAEYFSLIIFFVEDNSLADVFKTRLYHQQKGQVSALKILKPKNSNNLTGEFFSTLEQVIIPDVKVPLWLDISQQSNGWDIARDDFFSRLNEYRDQLRRKFLYPVIIVVPLRYKSRLRNIAPDLWSIRSFTDELLSYPMMNKATDGLVDQLVSPYAYDFQSKLVDTAEIIEWQRVLTQDITDHEKLTVGWRAFDAAFKQGDRNRAEEIVNICLAIIRKQIKKSTDAPEPLRLLTAFLNKKGDLQYAQGRREAAYELYQESLKISRRLLETLGETPETLRDLSVSLNNVAEQESILGFHKQSEKNWGDCLLILERLKKAIPANQEYDEIIRLIKQR